MEREKKKIKIKKKKKDEIFLEWIKFKFSI